MSSAACTCSALRFEVRSGLSVNWPLATGPMQNGSTDSASQVANWVAGWTASPIPARQNARTRNYTSRTTFAR